MSLLKELAAEAVLSRARMPEEFWEAIDAKTAELARAGLAQSCLQQGQTMPAFSLPNAVGKVVSSEAKLADGPLVVSFYRGSW